MSDKDKMELDRDKMDLDRNTENINARITRKSVGRQADRALSGGCWG